MESSDPSIIESNPINEPSAAVPPSQSKKLFLGILIGSLATAAILSSLLFIVSNRNKSNQISQTEIEAESISPTEPSPTAAEKPTATIQWLKTPEAVTPVNLFASLTQESFFTMHNAKAFKVATLEDGTDLINGYFSVNAPSEAVLVRYLKTPSNTYQIISQGLDAWTLESLKKEVKPDVAFSDKFFSELEIPSILTLDSAILEKGYYSGKLLSDYKNATPLVNVSRGSLYTVTQPILDSTTISARSLLLLLKDGTVVPYTIKQEVVTDDQMATIRFTDASRNATRYIQAITPSCGAAMANTVPVITKEASLLAQKETVGTTKDNHPVYQLKKSDNELVKKLYQQVYMLGRDYEGAPPSISLEEFAAAPNHFLWQDPFGDYQIFMNQEFAPMVECGKPVIYLYPEKATQVSVAVAADVTVSEPQYPRDGWHVLAQPDGLLTYQGKTYPSLFWEGTGKGIYPSKSDYGVMVTQAELIPTLRKHLVALGLNQKESQDFLDFWLPKLPSKPYVRLTWLGTQEMNQLAPLTVSPAPDTLIRIFLEFEGLDTPHPLKPQVLKSPTRKGFTLVEWGGLLLNSR